MSIGPLSPVHDATGTLAQAKAADVARAQAEASLKARQVDSHARSEAAAGVSAPDGELSVTDERDSDGRRPWEASAPQENPTPPASAADAANPDLGRGLDLTA